MARDTTPTVDEMREWFSRHESDYCVHDVAPPAVWAIYFRRLLELAAERPRQQQQRAYDSTVARIAGNVASGLVGRGTWDGNPAGLARAAVAMAREIVAAMERPQSADAVDPVSRITTG